MNRSNPQTPEVRATAGPVGRVAMVLAVGLAAAWLVVTLNLTQVSRAEAAPRPVTPRGELTAEELANIAVFETWKSSVVFISTTERVVDFWTRNVMSVPRGTGSG